MVRCAVPGFQLPLSLRFSGRIPPFAELTRPLGPPDRLGASRVPTSAFATLRRINSARWFCDSSKGNANLDDGFSGCETAFSEFTRREMAALQDCRIVVLDSHPAVKTAGCRILAPSGYTCLSLVRQWSGCAVHSGSSAWSGRINLNSPSLARSSRAWPQVCAHEDDACQPCAKHCAANDVILGCHVGSEDEKEPVSNQGTTECKQCNRAQPPHRFIISTTCPTPEPPPLLYPLPSALWPP